MKYNVEGTTRDGGTVEDEIENLREACLRAQGIEEDGGHATVTDEDGREVDHWDGYRVGLTPEAGLVLGRNIGGGDGAPSN